MSIIKKFQLKLQNPYPAVNPEAGGSVFDVIAGRKIAEDSEDSEPDETTTLLPDHELMRRSLSEDIIVFTRRGFYRLIENRLNK